MQCSVNVAKQIQQEQRHATLSLSFTWSLSFPHSLPTISIRAYRIFDSNLIIQCGVRMRFYIFLFFFRFCLVFQRFLFFSCYFPRFFLLFFVNTLVFFYYSSFTAFCFTVRSLLSLWVSFRYAMVIYQAIVRSYCFRFVDYGLTPKEKRRRT